MISSSHLILCHLLLLLPSIFLCTKVFSNESALRIRWPKCWSFSFNINPFNQYSELISFRIAWFDLLAIQGARKSLLQHHSLKASFLWCSAFFTVQRCFLKIIYFLAVLGLCYCESFSLAVASSGYSLVAVSRPLIVGASLVRQFYSRRIFLNVFLYI